jgi:hypothetical protein
LTVLRSALQLAVNDKIISEKPVGKKFGVKYRKRAKPIRLTPTFEQFKAIVTSIRAQRFNRERSAKKAAFLCSLFTTHPCISNDSPPLEIIISVPAVLLP